MTEYTQLVAERVTRYGSKVINRLGWTKNLTNAPGETTTWIFDSLVGASQATLRTLGKLVYNTDLMIACTGLLFVRF